MKRAITTGISFGVTSAIMTTVGLLVGLSSGTGNKLIVIGGVLTIAIADSLADSLGIHISEDSENRNTNKEVWTSTISTFISKIVVTSSFIIPLFLLDLRVATVVSIIWGGLLLSVFSYYLAKDRGESPAKVITEHLFVATLIIIATYFVGKYVGMHFR